MKRAVRTPYQACKEAAEQLDQALKKVGIIAPASRVVIETYPDGVRATRVAPPLLTPSQVARLAPVAETPRR